MTTGMFDGFQRGARADFRALALWGIPLVGLLWAACLCQYAWWVRLLTLAVFSPWLMTVAARPTTRIIRDLWRHMRGKP